MMKFSILFFFLVNCLLIHTNAQTGNANEKEIELLLNKAHSKIITADEKKELKAFAFDIQNKYFHLKDSVFTIERAEKLSEVKTNFEVNKKASELKLISEIEKENKNQNKNNNTNKNKNKNNNNENNDKIMKNNTYKINFKINFIILN